MIAAAGILYITPQPEPQVLLLRRTGVGGDFPNTWALPGGRIEDGEDAEQAAVREAREEMGEHPSGALEPWMRRTQHGVDYTTFLCRVAEPFEPALNEEHDAYRWVPVSDLRELWKVDSRSDAGEFEESKHPRDESGKFSSGGSTRSSASINSLGGLKEFANNISKLPEDDQKYEYFHHSVRTASDLDSILEEGVQPSKGHNAKLSWLSKGDLRNVGAGYVIVRVPRGEANKRSGETEPGGKKLPEWIVDKPIPPGDIISVVRAIKTTEGGHTIDEDELARYAASHQGEDHPDLPEKYQCWFHLGDTK